MIPLSSYFAVFALFCSFTFSTANSNNTYNYDNFLQCLENYSHDNSSNSISKVVYTQSNSSYSSVLSFSIQNRRFASNSTPKPLIIVTPVEISQIQATIRCSKRFGLQIRTRSGGHDYEGLSYVAHVPFLILDLLNLREIEVDVENNTAWVQAGATIGELYYTISQRSNNTLGFPAGVCPTTGVGGHISGGGVGFLTRKHGLSADNIINAHVIDVKSRVLDRESMGEDLFWAIRGGGGASFGVIIAWKVKLVPVPSTVTVFTVPRTLEQNATKLVHKWQVVANEIGDDIAISVSFITVNSSQTGKLTILATFEALFLGGTTDELIPLMNESFPELGLVREDCTEMSWIQSTLYLNGFRNGEPLEILLNRSQPSVSYLKGKYDYVQVPIPEEGLEGLWQLFYEDDAQAAFVMITFNSYGGIMNEISESEIPYPHRVGNLYVIQHLIIWQEEGDEAAQRSINWIRRRLYDYLEAFVSKSPRAAYYNARDLDIGVNNVNGYTSYEEASVWGLKYFKNNFNRLARVKTSVDPFNFFRNEQSIPSLVYWGGRKIETEFLTSEKMVKIE